jgi:hypothetical protein
VANAVLPPREQPQDDDVERSVDPAPDVPEPDVALQPPEHPSARQEQPAAVAGLCTQVGGQSAGRSSVAQEAEEQLVPGAELDAARPRALEAALKL